MSDLDLLDRKLCNVLQSRFPLTERPYDDMGKELSISQEEALERVKSLKRRHIVRQISAIFDTRRLGYRSTLVAMRYPKEGLAKGAKIINKHPGVSHNYERDHRYNLWFTLAVPPNGSLEDTVQDMALKSGAEAYAILPTVRFFKIGVNFDMVEGEGASYEGIQDGAPQVESFSPFEIRCIQELQEDLSVEPEPFKAMADRLGITQAHLFDIANDFIQRKVMRRFSAVLYHRKAGFMFNAMAVWQVPEEQAEAVGKIMASSPAVSHCYQRPSYPDWPYTHFTMVHGTSKEQCERAIKDIAAKTGIKDYAFLYSLREFKKTRVRYFV